MRIRSRLDTALDASGRGGRLKRTVDLSRDAGDRMRPRSRYARPIAALAIALSFGPPLVAQAQTQRGFTVDDALNVVSYSQTDLSDDGKWLATISAARRDGLGVDY